MKHNLQLTNLLKKLETKILALNEKDPNSKFFHNLDARAEAIESLLTDDLFLLYTAKEEDPQNTLGMSFNISHREANSWFNIMAEHHEYAEVKAELIGGLGIQAANVEFGQDERVGIDVKIPNLYVN